MTVLFIVVAVTLLVSAFCSLLEATLYSTRMATLEAAAKTEERRAAAERFLQMKKDISIPTSAILILNTVANTAGAALAGMYAARLIGGPWVALFSIVLTLVILFFAEILPKTYGAVHWRGLWAAVVWPLAVIERGLFPLIRVTRKFSQLFTPKHIPQPVTEEEILAMIHVGGRTGELTAAELRMLDAVLHFDKLLCRQVMVPRSEVAYMEAGWPLAQCLEQARQSQHTRYPVCKGGLDEVLGILHMKDLLGVETNKDLDVTTVLRPARHVPETKRINELLTEMQRTRQHMAVVVDEHGSTAGIITLENILEEIVGAVQDEFDSEAPEMVRQGKDAYVIRGGIHLEKVNRALHLDLRAPNVNTLSGYLVSRMGRFLEAGDRVEAPGIEAEVLEVEGNRATRIRLRLVEKSEQ